MRDFCVALSVVVQNHGVYFLATRHTGRPSYSTEYAHTGSSSVSRAHQTDAILNKRKINTMRVCTMHVHMLLLVPGSNRHLPLCKEGALPFSQPTHRASHQARIEQTAIRSGVPTCPSAGTCCRINRGNVKLKVRRPHHCLSIHRKTITVAVRSIALFSEEHASAVPVAACTRPSAVAAAVTPPSHTALRFYYVPSTRTSSHMHAPNNVQWSVTPILHTPCDTTLH